MRRTALIVGGLVISAIVVVAASLWASGDPDGLERVAENQEFIDAGRDAPFDIIADYVFPGLEGPMATVVAGLIGVVVVFGLVWLVGRALSARRATAEQR